MRHLPLAVTALACALLVGGCDASEPSPRGAVAGVVVADGIPLVGVTVEVSGPIGDVTTTDDAGRFGFQDLPSGAYVISIRGVPSDAAFPSTSRSAAVPEGGTVTVDFQGNFIRTASIIGTVTSREQGLSGVTVRIDGTESATTQTNTAGEFRFLALRSGAYTVEIAGFPGSVNFPTSRNEVALATGQTHVVNFEGTPDLTASVVIQSVVRRTASGGVEGVDPEDVRGRIEVNVSMDRGQDQPDSLIVLLGNQVVGRQYFQESGEDEVIGAADVPASMVQELTFPVNTASFDGETGVPRFLNGTRTLTVRLATREGGSTAAMASAPLTLRNADTFLAVLDPASGPVLGDDGQPWIGGDLAVRVLPVLYSEDRDLSSVSVEIRRSGGAQIARQSVGGTPPFELLFSPSSTGASSLAGYATPTGALDQVRVIAGGYAQGGTVPGVPVVVLDSLRIDQVPPEPSTLRLPTQGPAAACCSQNWVGESFAWEDAVGAREDRGVGGVTARFHVGAAALSNTQLLGSSPSTGVGSLSESEGNSAYRAVAVLSDALGNERVVPLEPTANNPLANERGGVFGVDRTPPVAQLDTSDGGLERSAVNPPPGDAWTLQASDARSGLAAVPFRTVVYRYAPEAGTEPVCVFPGTESCEPTPDGLLRTVPTAGDGYYRLEARALDRGGNLSVPIRTWALRDSEAPELPSLQVPSSLQPGADMTVTGEAIDDIDLHYVSVAVRFGEPGAIGAAWLPLGAPDEVGQPFSGALTPTASFQVQLPYAGAVEATSLSGAPSGTLQPASAVIGEAYDAAGNRGQRAAAPPLLPGFQPRSFLGSERGPQGAVERWEISADGSAVCGDGWEPESVCVDPGSGEVLDLQVAVRGVPGGLQEPFASVVFLARIDPDHVRWLGRDTRPELLEDGAGGTGPLWRWRLAWSPGAGFPAGEFQVFAVGVDANGMALQSREVPVEVIPSR